MEAGLKEKTGHDLGYWIDVVQKSGFEKHKAIIDHLKSAYGFTYGYANFVALKSRQADAASFDDAQLLDDQYNGKENLRPIYEKLMSAIEQFGSDVKVAPKKSSVSLIRKHQFALIKPATKTRIDLGLKIKDKPTEGRLEDSGPFGTMCTHRVRISESDEIDDELLGWIREAYEHSV